MNKSLPSSAVLTVTCDRDRWCFERQYIQMSRLCMPTTWYIVCNELEPNDWLRWFKIVQKHCPQDHLDIKLLTPKELDSFKQLKGFNGYWRQQFYKLLVAKTLDIDLLVILDSKNWLIKPWHPLMHRVPPRSELEEHWQHFHKNREFAEQLWGSISDLTREILPPVAWEPPQVQSMLDEVGGFSEFVKRTHSFFGFGNYCPINQCYSWPETEDTLSEFMLYDYWIQNQQHQELLAEEMWPNNKYNVCLGWDWRDIPWDAFDNVFKDPSTYWITIKWHAEEHMNAQRAESLWVRTRQMSWDHPEFKTPGWLSQFSSNHNSSY